MPDKPTNTTEGRDLVKCAERVAIPSVGCVPRYYHHKPCQRWAAVGSKFCWQHRKMIEETTNA